MDIVLEIYTIPLTLIEHYGKWIAIPLFFVWCLPSYITYKLWYNDKDNRVFFMMFYNTVFAFGLTFTWVLLWVRIIIWGIFDIRHSNID
jgi:hypothetical protein